MLHAFTLSVWCFFREIFSFPNVKRYYSAINSAVDNKRKLEIMSQILICAMGFRLKIFSRVFFVVFFHVKFCCVCVCVFFHLKFSSKKLAYPTCSNEDVIKWWQRWYLPILFKTFSVLSIQYMYKISCKMNTNCLRYRY